ncbi:MAG TPA: monofunctional biosynthetic peptidoglycan transglycosylase [Candidatus Polarisedimenticolia bacterium]|jgi:monofunctional biosynthetic peptidoglycan transglycosylase|nr:monofunctional biosynthetic peptidoglycan transglycosylase [Candidatus Polarisedimenticolia bacterium]
MSWARRIVLVVFVPLVALPVCLTLVYRFLPPPTTPLAVSTWWRKGTIYKVWTPLEGISPALVRATIGAEDDTFCTHHGFDWQAIGKAIRQNDRGRRVRGGSTISQQTAKNVFLTPHRNWLRKGLETYLTVMIEALWSKRRILEIYLNEVQFGPRVFGAEAAAEYYFHKPAARLDEAEAARLAAVLPDPEDWRVVDAGPYVESRTRALIDRITEVQRDGLDACIWK